MFKLRTVLLLASLASSVVLTGCEGEKADDAAAKALAESIPKQALGEDPGLVEGVDEATLVGGNLSCCSDKKCENQVWTGNSIHNCCANRGGKSWTCPTIADGECIKCAFVNQGHCP